MTRANASPDATVDDDGFVIVPSVLSSADLAAMNAAWDDAARALPNDGAATNWGPDLRGRDAFRLCEAHPRVMPAVHALLGPSVELRSLHGRAPPMGHGRQGLHADWPVPAMAHAQLLANAFFALDDVDPENGATRIVPGSHRWRQVPRGRDAQPTSTHPAERFVSLRAGDACVFSGHLWHAGSLNESGRRRRIVLVQFARAGAARMPTVD